MVGDPKNRSIETLIEQMAGIPHDLAQLPLSSETQSVFEPGKPQMGSAANIAPNARRDKNIRAGKVAPSVTMITMPALASAMPTWVTSISARDV